MKSIKFGRGLQAATFRRPTTKARCRRANQLNHVKWAQHRSWFQHKFWMVFKNFIKCVDYIFLTKQDIYELVEETLRYCFLSQKNYRLKTEQTKRKNRATRTKLKPYENKRINIPFRLSHQSAVLIHADQSKSCLVLHHYFWITLYKDS